MSSPSRPQVLRFAAALLALAPVASEAAEEPAPPVVDTLQAEGDFIDDPFALSPDGSSIAWLTTDGATRTRLHVRAIAAAARSEAVKPARESVVSTITAERVEFLDAERVIVIDRSPATGLCHAEIHGPAKTGKASAAAKPGAASKPSVALAHLGPATDIALGTVGGTPAIVTYLKTGTKTFTHTVSAFRRDDLRPIGKKVFVENAEGRAPVPGGLGKPLYFEDAYTLLVVQKQGDFDKARDIRKPDLEARLEVFSGKYLVEREIGDVVAFAQLGQDRKKHQADRAYPRYSEDLQALELVDADDQIVALHPARPLRKYDATTLSYQADGAAGLWVGLSVDPVNAEAVAAKKADADDLEVYHLDVKAKALSRVARIDGQKRATAFRLSGGRLGVLRKHKGFGRGGETLEIFELASLRPAPSPRPTDKLAPPVPSDKPVPAASPAATPSPSSSTSPTSKKK